MFLGLSKRDLEVYYFPHPLYKIGLMCEKTAPKLTIFNVFQAKKTLRKKSITFF